MRDREARALAARQFNRIARRQLEALGWTAAAIDHRVESGRFAGVEDGVYAIAPELDDPWGRWMGATLTEPGTVLALWSAAAAYGALEREVRWTTVMRPGRAGPRVHGGIKAWRRPDLEGETGALRGVPVTSPERTLLDLAPYLPHATQATALRNMVRLRHTSLARITEYVAGRPKRRGARKLMRAVASHAGLPIERARSGSEVRAMQVLRDARRELPAHNQKIAGFEADLVWREAKLIVEIDGGPFHEDRGEDARKEAAWSAEGFDVRRIASGDVWRRPRRLLALVLGVGK